MATKTILLNENENISLTSIECRIKSIENLTKGELATPVKVKTILIPKRSTSAKTGVI